MNFRKATKDDIEQIIDLRIRLLTEEAVFEVIDIKKELRDYFYEELNKTIIISVAEDEGELVATSAVMIQQYPPSFGNREGLRAYITNVYTAPQYRRKGLGTKLLDILVEEVKNRGLSYIWLWSTKQGVPLYKKYGFKDLTTFATMDFEIKP